MKNNEEKVEAFLAKLPKDTVAKIKKLKFANNLVLINRRYNLLQNVETGELIKKSDWNYTIPELVKKLHVSRSWLYNNLQSKVRYIYINNFDIESMTIFYEKSIKDLRYYQHLAPIHLNTQDVVKWFNDTFIHGKRSVVIDSQRIFGKESNQILLDYAIRSIRRLLLDMNELNKYALDPKLWNLCRNAPVLHKTSKYPMVIIPKSLTPIDFNNIKFHTLSEYKYSANGMRELLTSGSDIYKGKNGKNSKMLFTFSDNDPFDVNWMYQELSKRLNSKIYSPRVIDDTVTTLANMFVVPAVQYFKDFLIS